MRAESSSPFTLFVHAWVRESILRTFRIDTILERWHRQECLCHLCVNPACAEYILHAVEIVAFADGPKHFRAATVRERPTISVPARYPAGRSLTVAARKSVNVTRRRYKGFVIWVFYLSAQVGRNLSGFRANFIEIGSNVRVVRSVGWIEVTHAARRSVSLVKTWPECF